MTCANSHVIFMPFFNKSPERGTLFLRVEASFSSLFIQILLSPVLFPFTADFLQRFCKISRWAGILHALHQLSRI